MSDFIKGFFKIEKHLNNEQKKDLENYAYQYAKFFKVYFKITTIVPKEKTIIIQISQKKKPSKNPYFTIKELSDIVQKTFLPYFEDYKIHKDITPYKPAPAEIVTPEWIKAQMNKYKIGNKKLAFDFGLLPSETSAIINGHREMGIRTKGLFFYYFKFIELERN